MELDSIQASSRQAQEEYRLTKLINHLILPRGTQRSDDSLGTCIGRENGRIVVER